MPVEVCWSVRLPVVLSPAGLPPAPDSRLQEWVFDTGFSGEALAWRHHLEQAGLDPDTDRTKGMRLRWSADATVVVVPVRIADLWLVSDEPGNPPYCLELQRGVAFVDRAIPTPDPEYHRALIGMRPFIRAGVRVEIDYKERTVSVWTPELALRNRGS
jgi:hypothetical protein